MTLLDLYAWARMDLGVTLDEWRRLTPRTLIRLHRRAELHRKREDARFGLLASLLHAPNRKKGTPVKGALEWFEGPKEPKEEAMAAIARIEAYKSKVRELRVSA